MNVKETYERDQIIQKKTYERNRWMWKETHERDHLVWKETYERDLYECQKTYREINSRTNLTPVIAVAHEDPKETNECENRSMEETKEYMKKDLQRDQLANKPDSRNCCRTSSPQRDQNVKRNRGKRICVNDRFHLKCTSMKEKLCTWQTPLEIPPKSTKSQNSDYLIQIQIGSNFDLNLYREIPSKRVFLIRGFRGCCIFSGICHEHEKSLTKTTNLTAVIATSNQMSKETKDVISNLQKRPMNVERDLWKKSYNEIYLTSVVAVAHRSPKVLCFSKKRSLVRKPVCGVLCMCVCVCVRVCVCVCVCVYICMVCVCVHMCHMSVCEREKEREKRKEEKTDTCHNALQHDATHCNTMQHIMHADS